MEQSQPENTVAELTDNNKKLLRPVVGALLDQVAFHSKDHVTVTVDGLESLLNYKKALQYLKQKNIIFKYSFLKGDEVLEDSRQPMDWVTVFFDFNVLNDFNNLLLHGSVAAVQTGYIGAIEYDDEHAVITFNGKSVTLFSPEILEAFLFGKVHKADGARLNSIHLVEEYEDKHRDDDILINNKALTNAKDRINKKFAAEFGADNIVMYERSQFWLNHSYISESSPYRTG